MMQVRLEGYESFDGIYDVKDQVLISGKKYYRIGKDGINDIVVNVDNIVISWDLPVDSTREWFIEDTIDQLIADGELKRGQVKVEYIVDTSRPMKEIVAELYKKSLKVQLDLNDMKTLEVYTFLIEPINMCDLCVAYDSNLNENDYMSILKMITRCLLVLDEVDELSNGYISDLVNDGEFVDELVKLWFKHRNK